jgi:hypothetical protein
MQVKKIWCDRKYFPNTAPLKQNNVFLVQQDAKQTKKNVTQNSASLPTNLS